MFRKLEEMSRVRPVAIQPKHRPACLDYFKGKTVSFTYTVNINTHNQFLFNWPIFPQLYWVTLVPKSKVLGIVVTVRVRGPPNLRHRDWGGALIRLKSQVIEISFELVLELS